MRKAAAPNDRMESIASNLEQELPDNYSDKEKMFELLYLLGLSKPDLDGTAVFKKERLVPESTLRFYINSALRLLYLQKSGQPFSHFAKQYWRKYPKDRIMQLYTFVQIQSTCEQVTSQRVVQSHNRKETDALKSKLQQLCQLLVQYAEERPDAFDLP